MISARIITRRGTALALSLMLLPTLVTAKTPAQRSAPAALHDGWKTAAPAAEGLDPKLICAIGPTLEKMTDADPHAVVIVRHGALVYEHYFSEGDELWPGQVMGQVRRNASTLHDVASITKSVTALLTGIALDRGWLKSLDASVFSFFPQYADLRTPEKDRITLRNLLTMTSGLAWPELAVSYTNSANIDRRMWNASDPFRFLLRQPLAAVPGTMWNYNSGAVDLLGAILEKTCRCFLDRFAKEALFDPLGIVNWRWGHAAGGLELRPRDLAKIGQLVLNHGLWHGRRIVSAAWIKAMTARQIPGWTISLRGKTYSYGYLWWLGRSSIDNHNTEWVGGLGRGGQRLFVVPSRDLIVVVNAGVYIDRIWQGLAGYTALNMVLHAAIEH